MKMAVVVNAHSNPEVIRDTLDSVRAHLSVSSGDKLLLMLDGGTHDGLVAQNDFDCEVLRGFKHMCGNSPYRNVCLGLRSLYDGCPDADWYLYMEQDCLITSGVFKDDLQKAGTDVGCFGFWVHQTTRGFSHKEGVPILEGLWGGRMNYWWMLGCYFFIRRDILDALKNRKNDFLGRLLVATDGFGRTLPGIDPCHCVEETLIPSVVASLGKRVCSLAALDKTAKRYKVVNRPDFLLMDLDLSAISLVHPTKEMGPLREVMKKIRDGEPVPANCVYT